MKKRIAPRNLQPGFKLPGNLFSKSGKVLIRGGTTLGADQLVLITEYVEEGVFGDASWASEFEEKNPGQAPARGQDGGRTISVADLKSGMRLTQDIYDAKSDVLLLAAGFQITPRFLRLLGSRGISTICIRPRADRKSALQAERGTEVGEAQTKALDALLENELKKRIPFREVSPTERPRLGLDDLKGEAKLGVEVHYQTTEVFADMCSTLSKGRDICGRDINDVLKGFARRALMDVDLLPLIVSLHNAADDYLFSHSLNVALISMSMATQAGLAQDKVLEIGFGSLLQDIGMLQVPEDIRFAPRPLTTEERAEVDRHPLYAIDWLSRIDVAPLTAGLILYQSHERNDGTGFPRSQEEARIHPFAKIVNIADTYAAMTHERPFRPAYRPYEAAREVLTCIGRYDRAMARLFLDTVGLFPVGSVVELNNGYFAHVVRAIPGAHTRPVVEQVDKHGRPTGRLVNLSAEQDLRVVRAYHGPGNPERPLTNLVAVGSH